MDREFGFWWVGPGGVRLAMAWANSRWVTQCPLTGRIRAVSAYVGVAIMRELSTRVREQFPEHQRQMLAALGFTGRRATLDHGRRILRGLRPWADPAPPLAFTVRVGGTSLPGEWHESDHPEGPGLWTATAPGRAAPDPLGSAATQAWGYQLAVLAGWPAWRDGTVRAVAAGMRAAGAWVPGVLADALEEAGMRDAAYLRRLRATRWPQPVAARRWAVDAADLLTRGPGRRVARTGHP
jgi:hypothetical protein